jgi:hypothetical protein
MESENKKLDVEKVVKGLILTGLGLAILVAGIYLGAEEWAVPVGTGVAASSLV